VRRLHTSHLSEYVAAVAAAKGDFDDDALKERYIPFDLDYDTKVDTLLDPFSDEYFQQQIALYTEIAGRFLNQASGELHPMNIEPLIGSANPLGSRDVASTGEQVRVISTMLAMACLKSEPRVLDMGAGQGLSSEIYAFSGCRVHAIDIDPVLGELSRRRAADRGLDILRSTMNFDDIVQLEEAAYEAAFFYQSLHHCLKPWELIKALSTKIREDGVIVFSGEPIQTHWWPHWGVRLDHVSLFVARGHGWFESGFSHGFLSNCFARNGFRLDFFRGGQDGGEIGIATQSPERREEVLQRAKLLGLDRVDGGAPNSSFHSKIGRSVSLFGRPGYEQVRSGSGVLIYGPYQDLKPGKYKISAIVHVEGEHGSIVIDVVSRSGEQKHFEKEFFAISIGLGKLIHFIVDFPEGARAVEVRGAVVSGQGWSISLPTIISISAP